MKNMLFWNILIAFLASGVGATIKSVALIIDDNLISFSSDFVDDVCDTHPQNNDCLGGKGFKKRKALFEEFDGDYGLLSLDQPVYAIREEIKSVSGHDIEREDYMEADYQKKDLESVKFSQSFVTIQGKDAYKSAFKCNYYNICFETGCAVVLDGTVNNNNNLANIKIKAFGLFAFRAIGIVGNDLKVKVLSDDVDDICDKYVNVNLPEAPTSYPTKSPTDSPTAFPTLSPTSSPTKLPTDSPTAAPTSSPTSFPTKSPTDSPTTFPTSSPTDAPTKSPTAFPTDAPTKSPTESPTISPTNNPTISDLQTGKRLTGRACEGWSETDSQEFRAAFYKEIDDITGRQNTLGESFYSCGDPDLQVFGGCQQFPDDPEECELLGDTAVWLQSFGTIESFTFDGSTGGTSNQAFYGSF